jgi:hypothetical protein
MISGTIANIVPLGQYNSQNGVVFTFTMTINSELHGAVTGEIGSKSNVYPMKIGENITVEVTQSDYGTRFKKINPQYQRQGPPTPTPPSNYDRAVERLDAQAQQYQEKQIQILRQCAGKIAAALVAGSIETYENRFKEAEKWVGYFKKGLTPNLLPAKERFPSTESIPQKDIRGMPEDQVPY